nr:selenate reductase [uncultured Cellulosilyticum sp.]
MRDKMRPMLFEKMIQSLMAEYNQSKSFYGVPVIETTEEVPIGPAAGPHTQLATNIICAYAAGATYFELKTVQVLEGKALNITKPCIYVGYEVYNTEWSTELTIKEAGDEYIKAYLLIGVLSRVLGLRPLEDVHFIMSVGYDLEGIKSAKVDAFIETMKKASLSEEWQKDCRYIRTNGQKLWGLSDLEIDEILCCDRISDTVTLSTLHGCKKEEIEEIATYLMKEKGLHTYVKLNPTLLGEEKIRQILDAKGYEDVRFVGEMFEKDLNLGEVQKLIADLQQVAKVCQRTFGIKLTNTLPVCIQHQELMGEAMYMSGPILYPIAMGVTYELAKYFRGDIKISYSGGIDTSNIKALLETGVFPITVSSFLLKPGGYKNLSRLIKASRREDKSEEQVSGRLQVEKLKALAEAAVLDKDYDYKATHLFKRSKAYDMLCSKCENCMDVCPNRANVAVQIEGKKYIVHIDDLCNECGCCACECIRGHSPYKEKLTLFTDKESFMNSTNDGVLCRCEVILSHKGENLILAYRKDGKLQSVSPLVATVVSKIKKEGRL